MKTRSFWRRNFRELEILNSQKLQPLDNKAHKGLLKNMELRPSKQIFL